MASSPTTTRHDVPQPAEASSPRGSRLGTSEALPWRRRCQLRSRSSLRPHRPQACLLQRSVAACPDRAWLPWCDRPLAMSNLYGKAVEAQDPADVASDSVEFTGVSDPCHSEPSQHLADRADPSDVRRTLRRPTLRPHQSMNGGHDDSRVLLRAGVEREPEDAPARGQVCVGSREESFDYVAAGWFELEAAHDPAATRSRTIGPSPDAVTTR